VSVWCKSERSLSSVHLQQSPTVIVSVRKILPFILTPRQNRPDWNEDEYQREHLRDDSGPSELATRRRGVSLGCCKTYCVWGGGTGARFWQSTPWHKTRSSESPDNLFDLDVISRFDIYGFWLVTKKQQQSSWVVENRVSDTELRTRTPRPTTKNGWQNRFLSVFKVYDWSRRECLLTMQRTYLWNRDATQHRSKRWILVQLSSR
jgi:hypothetical protein